VGPTWPPVGTGGSYPGVKQSEHEATTLLHPLPRLRISGAVLHSPCVPLWNVWDRRYVFNHGLPISLLMSSNRLWPWPAGTRDYEFEFWSGHGYVVVVVVSFIEVRLWVRHTHCIPPLNFWNFVKNMLHRQENRPRAFENRLLGER